MTTKTGDAPGIPYEERRRLARLIRDADAEWVVLIGSWARGTQSAKGSDVDVLVGGPARARPGPAERLHVIYLDSHQLKARALTGDDVALWCLMFGLPLSGARRWLALKDAVLALSPKPDARKKFELASRLLRYSEELLEMDDIEGAQEELQVAAEHLARGHLILNDVFPLSRPEIPSQLVSTGLGNLGSLIQTMARHDADAESLHDALRAAHDLLTQGLSRWSRCHERTFGASTPAKNQQVRAAAERLRRAQEDYESFAGRSVAGGEPATHSVAELAAAQERLVAAEEDLRRLLDDQLAPLTPGGPGPDRH